MQMLMQENMTNSARHLVITLRTPETPFPLSFLLAHGRSSWSLKPWYMRRIGLWVKDAEVSLSEDRPPLFRERVCL